MKKYLKPTLLALLISTACAFAKGESEWTPCSSPFEYRKDYPVNVTLITTSQDGRLIHVVTKSASGHHWLYKSADAGVTWSRLDQK